MRFMTTTAAITVLALLTACNESRMTRDVTGGQNPIPYNEQPGRSNAQKIETWSGVGSSQQGSSIEEAERRLARLANYMKSRGPAATFNSLNGKDSSTNNAGQRLQDEDFKVLISDPDGRVSGVRCIENSRYVVTGTGGGVGSDANAWRDVSGKPVLMSMIQSLHGMPTARVNYTTAVASPLGGAPITQNMTAVAASSSFLLGQKNTGKPFLCWIDVEGN